MTHANPYVIRSIAVSFIVIIFVALFIAQPTRAEERPVSYVAVLDLDVKYGIEESIRHPLSDRLRQELYETGRFKVIERNQMNNILEEQGLQLSGCTTDECAVEAGKLLGVDSIIAGSFAKVGKMYTLTVRIIDVETGELSMVKSLDCACPIEQVLTQKIREAARLLAGLDDDTEPATQTKPTPTRERKPLFKPKPKRTPKEPRQPLDRKTSFGISISPLVILNLEMQLDLFSDTLAFENDIDPSSMDMAGAAGVKIGMMVDVPLSNRFVMSGRFGIGAFSDLDYSYYERELDGDLWDENSQNYLYAYYYEEDQFEFTKISNVSFDLDFEYYPAPYIYFLGGLGINIFKLEHQITSLYYEWYYDYDYDGIYDDSTAGQIDNDGDIPAFENDTSLTKVGLNLGMGFLIKKRFGLETKLRVVSEANQLQFMLYYLFK